MEYQDFIRYNLTFKTYGRAKHIKLKGIKNKYLRVGCVVAILYIPLTLWLMPLVTGCDIKIRW